MKHSLVPFGPVFLILISLVLAPGCNNQPKDADADPDEGSTKVVNHKVNVLMYGDQELKETIERQWKSVGHEIELTVIDRLDPQSEKIAEQFKGNDVVIYSPKYLGTLVSEKRLQEVDFGKLDRKLLAEGDLVRLQRRDMVQYGGSVWGTSMGSPLFSLVYREDVLQALGEQVPTDWEQYERIAQKLASVKGKLKDKDGQVLPTDVIEPRAGQWAGHLLMVRAASAVCRRGQRANQMSLGEATPLIDLPPFRRSLENMKNALAGHVQDELNPQQVFEKMVKGEAAMALTWPTSSIDFDEAPAGLSLAAPPKWRNQFDLMSKTWGARKDEQTEAALVGFDGKMASLIFGARHRDSAEYFLAWICSSDIQQKIWSRSPHCSISRTSQIQKPYVWCGRNSPRAVADRYAELVKTLNKDGLPMSALRIPNCDQYQNHLSEAVREVLNSGADPKSALQKAVEGWNQVTDSTGRKETALEYRRSVGLNN